VCERELVGQGEKMGRGQQDRRACQRTRHHSGEPGASDAVGPFEYIYSSYAALVGRRRRKKAQEEASDVIPLGTL
jgi:hypothetical protein